MIIDKSSDKTLLDTGKRKRRSGYFSLNKVFIIAFSIVIMLSSIIASIAYDRLAEFQILLDDTTENSLPKVMNYAKIYSQVNELSYTTESLTHATSQVQRKIALDTINIKIADIYPLVTQFADNEQLLAQIKIIEQELSALNELIEKRLDIKSRLQKQKELVYRIYDIAINDEALANADFANATSAMIIEAEEGLTYKRLNYIKQASRKTDLKYNYFVRVLNLSTAQQLLFDDLRAALTGELGVLPLKMEQLRTIARTRGRSDFVRNLVIDYARLTEFESFKYKKSLIVRTDEFSNTVAQQTKLLGIFAIFALLGIITIVFFIQRRLIRRLVLLNKKVISRLAGRKSDLKVGGNDEITDIARSFEGFAKTIERQKKELIQTSLTDGLTNIANRRALDKTFKHLLLSAQRQKWPVAVLMMDVDNFKTYNDFYGHVAGDECLKKIAQILKNILKRPEDFVGRYGGEEFVCLLPNTPLEGAKGVAAAILGALMNENIGHERSSVANHVTLSIGISLYACEAQESTDSLLKQADSALYRAKNHGKNCYSI